MARWYDAKHGWGVVMSRILTGSLALSLSVVVGCGGGGGGLVDALGSAVGSGSQSEPQGGLASLCFVDGRVKLCHRNDTEWSLAKTGSVSGNTVTWTVTATRGATSNDEIVVNGFVRVANYCPYPATIGNVVVNLQRCIGSGWVTVSSDVATSSQGDAATFARVVPGAAWDWWASSFSENSASGKLDVLDSSFNNLFSAVPRAQVDGESTKDLLFVAAFNNTVLGIPQGEQIYLEVVVSFGNAQAGGYGGASGQNIDIDGNSVVDSDEANVATRADDFLRCVPALEKCNDSVELSDTLADITSTTGVTYSGYTTDIGGGGGVESVSGSVVRTVQVSVDAGSNGTITNTARLEGADDFVVVWVYCPPPDNYTFPCCRGVSLSASQSLAIGTPPGGLAGEYKTFTQGGWGSPPAGSNPGQVLAGSFATVYPNGLKVGVTGKSMTFTSSNAVSVYLPAGGAPGTLTADLVDPPSSSAGVLGGQVVALRLNVDMSAAGVTGDPMGGLKLANTGTSLDGKTVTEILAAAEQALGGGALPSGYTLASLNDLVTNLNEAFTDSVPSAWAAGHLVE